MNAERRLYSNGLKLFDLLLMAASFTVATLPLFHRVGRMSLEEFFALRVKVGNLALFVSFLLVWNILFSMFGLYRSKRLSGRFEEMRDIVASTTIGTVVIAGAALVFRIWVVNRVFLLLFWLLTTGTVILSRTIIRASLAYAPAAWTQHPQPAGDRHQFPRHQAGGADSG